MDLRIRWLKFANKDEFDLPPRDDNNNDDNSGICIDHFEKKYIKRGITY